MAASVETLNSNWHVGWLGFDNAHLSANDSAYEARPSDLVHYALPRVAHSRVMPRLRREIEVVNEKEVS